LDGEEVRVVFRTNAVDDNGDDMVEDEDMDGKLTYTKGTWIAVKTGSENNLNNFEFSKETTVITGTALDAKTPENYNIYYDGRNITIGKPGQFVIYEPSSSSVIESSSVTILNYALNNQETYDTGGVHTFDSDGDGIPDGAEPNSIGITDSQCRYRRR
jgi:hypothetical protein